MSNLKKWISLILLTLLVFSLAACGSKSETKSESVSTADAAEASKTEKKEKKEEKKQADITGQYEITAMTTEGEETPSEDLALLQSKGLTCTVTLKTDGTGVLNLFGEESELTWDEQAIYTSEKKMPYTFQDGQLTLTDGNSSLTFLRKG